MYQTEEININAMLQSCRDALIYSVNIKARLRRKNCVNDRILSHCLKPTNHFHYIIFMYSTMILKINQQRIYVESNIIRISKCFLGHPSGSHSKDLDTPENVAVFLSVNGKA